VCSVVVVCVKYSMLCRKTYNSEIPVYFGIDYVENLVANRRPAKSLFINRYGETGLLSKSNVVLIRFAEFFLRLFNFYTVSQKKTRHQTLAHNFPKC